jgi:hypothetical protein
MFGVFHKEWITATPRREGVRSMKEYPSILVCKGGEGHKRWMAKVKTEAYLRRLRAFFKDDWRLYWE